LDIGDGLEILERARVLNNMAHIYLQYGEIDKATECFLQIKPLVKADDKDVNTIVSGFMGLITFESIILKQLRLSSEVEFTKIEELLNLRRRFMYINPEREIHEVGFIAYAHTLSEIANVLLEKDMYSEGLRYFEEAIQVLLEFHAKCSTYSGYIPKDLILVTTKNLELIAKSPNVLNDRLEKYIDDIVVITDSFVDIIRKSKNERNVKQNLLLRIVLSYYCLGTLSEIHGNDLAKRAFSLIHETEPIQQNVELYCILYSNLLLSGEEDKKYIYDISVTLRSFFPFLHSSDEEIIEIRKSALNYIETYEQGNAYPKKEGQVDENIPS
jgi:tetratricopeptide (TPR) repeat protein